MFELEKIETETGEFMNGISAFVGRPWSSRSIFWITEHPRYTYSNPNCKNGWEWVKHNPFKKSVGKKVSLKNQVFHATFLKMREIEFQRYSRYI